MRIRRLLTVWLAVIGVATASAESILIPFGDEEEQVGAYRDGGQIYGPSHVVLDHDRTLWIADSYKARVVHYSTTGQYLGSWACVSVSPRQTAFQQIDETHWLLVNDQSISVFDRAGRALSNTGLGMVIPRQFWASGAIFAEVDGGEGGSIWRWTLDLKNREKSSLRLPRGEVAALRQGRVWLTRWDDQSQAYRWKGPLKTEARLLAWDAEGRSLWFEQEASQVRLWWVNSSGELVPNGDSTWQGTRSRGAHVSASNDLDAVVSAWSENGLSIEILPRPY